MPVRSNGERGSSLVEVLIALAILGISAAALLGGISTLAITSSAHSNQARAETVLTSAAERLRDAGVAHEKCALATEPTYLAAVRLATVPSGWTASSAVSIEEVRYWDGSTFGATCYDDAAHEFLLTLQLVTIRVMSPDGRTVETVSVVKAP